MLQTLLYIPCELFGLPVFGFGLLLAVWAVASVAMLAWLIRRQGFNADTRSYAEVLAVLGAIIAWVLPLLCESRGLPIRGYGMMMLLAVLSGISLAAYRARRVGVDPEMIFTLAFWMILPGILGARIVYVCEYWFQDFWPEYKNGLLALVFAIVNVPKGGLVVYGAFFGGMLGLGLFWRRNRVPLLATADLIAPSMLLGLALGRVGCLLNGCCYGGPCDLPWKVTFPWNSPVHQHEAEEGIAGVFGLRFRDGPNDLPVIDSVAPDSPAARQGLIAGVEIDEVNGMSVAARRRITAKEQAARAVLGIDKLDLLLRGNGSEVSFGPVDDPPESQIHGSGPLKIYGLEIAGSDDQEAVVSHVRRKSPEASAGIREGQRVISISGRKVDTIGQLRHLLDEHRQHPWLRIRPYGQAQPIELAVDRPLPRSLPVHPTQLYSTIDALILCFLLLVYDRFRRRDGALTALMMTIYPITRFLIESIRTDEADIWGTGLHISQNISVGILVVAICLWIYILRRPAKLAFRA
ncbi:MAG: prolipoprotein diacylglyceryl transferase family protein [Thermoguttaceae bacterium]|jgi:phosphatidylglycerol:prolipoprotein diacylglycerol transferase